MVMVLAFRRTDCPALLYDGIYTYKVDAESSAVIRFYSDRLVLVSTSTNNYKEVMTWFNRDPENLSRVLTGKYSLKSGSCQLSFKVKGETGKQNYTGTLRTDKTLDLQIYNPATKTKTQRTYTFVKP